MIKHGLHKNWEISLPDCDMILKNLRSWSEKEEKG